MNRQVTKKSNLFITVNDYIYLLNSYGKHKNSSFNRNIKLDDLPCNSDKSLNLSTIFEYHGLHEYLFALGHRCQPWEIARKTSIELAVKFIERGMKMPYPIKAEGAIKESFHVIKEWGDHFNYYSAHLCKKLKDSIRKEDISSACLPQNSIARCMDYILRAIIDWAVIPIGKPVGSKGNIFYYNNNPFNEVAEHTSRSMSHLYADINPRIEKYSKKLNTAARRARFEKYYNKKILQEEGKQTKIVRLYIKNGKTEG